MCKDLQFCQGSQKQSSKAAFRVERGENFPVHQHIRPFRPRVALPPTSDPDFYCPLASSRLLGHQLPDLRNSFPRGDTDWRKGQTQDLWTSLAFSLRFLQFGPEDKLAQGGTSDLVPGFQTSNVILVGCCLQQHPLIDQIRNEAGSCLCVWFQERHLNLLGLRLCSL